MSAFIPEGYGARWESLSGSSEKRLVPPLLSEPASLLGVLLKLDLSPRAGNTPGLYFLLQNFTLAVRCTSLS